MAPRKREVRSCGSSVGFVCLLLLGVELLHAPFAMAAGKRAKDAKQLEHFYIVRMYWSDNLLDWIEKYLGFSQTKSGRANPSVTGTIISPRSPNPTDKL